MPAQRLTRLSAVLALTAAIAASTAAPASADSIVYLKDGNIYLTSPNGQLGYQVTTGGGWSSPSQADDGTIVAVRGQDIVHMDRSGHVLSEFAAVGGSAGSVLAGAQSLAGPYDAEVSPDDKSVAYWDIGDITTPSPECGINCGTSEYSDVTTVSAVDHFTFDGYDDDDATHPHWLGGSGQLVFTDASVNLQARIWTPGPDGSQQLDGNEHQWYGDPPQALGSPSYLFDNTIPNRDGSKVIAVGSNDGLTGVFHFLLFSATNGFGTATTPECAEGEDSSVGSVTWSPAGDKIAFDDADGIVLLPVPSALSGCDGISLSDQTVLIPGGSHPFWGPADVDTAQAPGASVPPAQPQTQPTPQPQPQPTPQTEPAPQPTPAPQTQPTPAPQPKPLPHPKPKPKPKRKPKRVHHPKSRRVRRGHSSSTTAVRPAPAP